MNSIELLRTLVAFDTTSRNSNLALVDWAVCLLERAGARIRLTYDDARTKANVLASFGPDVSGGILLSAHTDAVPVDDQDWSSDPFELVERDGRLHGRGTADMKGFVACCLAAVPQWAEASLNRPIHLALSYDEEIGCFGVPRLIRDLTSHVPKPAVAIVGEPTGMTVADHHRGYFGFRTTFHGRAAHSGDPAKGANAIFAAMQFVSRLEAMQAQRADGTARTTFSVGRIGGGTNINIVPSHCEILWEIRPAADADIASLRTTADELVVGAAPSDFKPDTDAIIIIPPLRPEMDNRAVALAQRFGIELTRVSLSFGTEAGFFQSAGIPAAVCGPGSIEQAHQPDEWIAIEQLEQASRFLDRVTQWATT
jgi:acetylornithine deacetylase